MLHFSNKSILVTGVAGFIGYFVTKRLLDMGYTVVGLDNLNDYYNVKALFYPRRYEVHQGKRDRGCCL